MAQLLTETEHDELEYFFKTHKYIWKSQWTEGEYIRHALYTSKHETEFVPTGDRLYFMSPDESKSEKCKPST